MTILRSGAWVRYPGPMPLRRMVLEFWFAASVLVHAWRLRSKADVAIAILPPSLFALSLNFLLPRCVRRIAVVHDLQGELAVQKRSFLRRVIARAIHAVESRVFRFQDLCVFFSTDMARVAKASYRLDDARVAVQYPFITLPSCPEWDAGVRPSPEPQRLAVIFPPERLHVAYSGALGYKQNSFELLEFMQAAAERFPDVQFHVLSGGPLFDELRSRYENISGPRVYFHPLVEEGDIAELYVRSAIQIVPQAEGTESGALPSKLPNLMAAGVFLLAVCAENSEVARLVQQAGTGSVVERWNCDLFLAKLGEALDVVRREPASARRARAALLLDQFSVANMARMVLGEQARPLPKLASEPIGAADELPVPGGVRR
jgi:glycosyltransferase involved in cell wall biosynthesis